MAAETISVFDMFKVGVGPSSSHTMGPWRASARFVRRCADLGLIGSIERIQADLYGSLAKTGRGHGIDLAIVLGLLGEDPETCDTAQIHAKVDAVRMSGRLKLGGTGTTAAFDPGSDLRFNRAVTLPFHPNGLRFTALLDGGAAHEETYYSVGGGFVVQEGSGEGPDKGASLPFPIRTAEDLLDHCRNVGMTIPEIVRWNERVWRDDGAILSGCTTLWETMKACVFRGCHTEGTLPGCLGVVRRAAGMSRRLLDEPIPFLDEATPVPASAVPACQGPAADGLDRSPAGGQETAGTSARGDNGDYRPWDSWIAAIRAQEKSFQSILRWVCCFALAVNEENASFGRVVTAPTNGSAGVIPAVLMYLNAFCGLEDADVEDFLLTAGQIGILFKQGATISAAMGGCQAEIGVSSAMAAAALTQCLGGSPEQVLMAAEIAMEHHLGLTCDPVAGLVQIPCIERNTMGAVKAITASNIALDSDPARAKVSLDAVVRSMWQTALEMNAKYKETSEAGLAANIPVNVSEC